MVQLSAPPDIDTFRTGRSVLAKFEKNELLVKAGIDPNLVTRWDFVNKSPRAIPIYTYRL